METEILSKRGERCKHFDLGNGKKKFVGYTAPIHYKNALTQNKWEDIVLNFQNNLGNLLTDKNKVSCGFRTDKKLHKYFGLRYDEDHQFEATIAGIKLDGIEQVSGDEFESAAEVKTKQAISNKFNSNVEIINRLNEVSLKNYFKIINPVEDFEIVEELHLKGLSCSNKKSGDKYIPDKQGRFNFIDKKKELKFWIVPPFFIDADRVRYNTIQHELRKTAGRFFYTKTPTMDGKDDLFFAKFPIEIDADTFYGDTADGQINHQLTSTWTAIVNAPTGYSVTDDSTQLGLNVNGNHDGKGGDRIDRAFAFFDTSSIGAGQVVTAAVLSLYGKNNQPLVCQVCVMKGTQADPLTTGDYSSWSGNYYAKIAAVSWVDDAYNDFTLDAQGRSDVEMEGITKYSIRDYDYDYLDSEPSGTNDIYAFAWSADEEEGGELRPRLVVTYEAVAGGPADITSINGIAIANIASVNSIAKADIETINNVS